MNSEGLILIVINLFITLSSFIIFYIKLIERLTRVETMLEHYIKVFSTIHNKQKDIY